jgi:hypothetical protein
MFYGAIFAWFLTTQVSFFFHFFAHPIEVSEHAVDMFFVYTCASCSTSASVVLPDDALYACCSALPSFHSALQGHSLVEPNVVLLVQQLLLLPMLIPAPPTAADAVPAPPTAADADSCTPSPPAFAVFFICVKKNRKITCQLTR